MADDGSYAAYDTREPDDHYPLETALCELLGIEQDVLASDWVHVHPRYGDCYHAIEIYCREFSIEIRPSVEFMAGGGGAVPYLTVSVARRAEEGEAREVAAKGRPIREAE